MSWTKADLQKIKGKVKSISIPSEPKNKVVIPKEIGKYKLHIIAALNQSGLNYFSEYLFDEVRKFRFDWAVPDLMIAIEYEGIFSEKSGHTTLSGYKKDIDKYNLAVKKGWKLLRYAAHNYLDIENDLKALILK